MDERRKMKTFINILIIVLFSYTISWSHQFVNAEDLEYSLSSQNIVYQGENTFIFLKISNNSDEESEIPGHPYYLQRFVAFNDKGDKLNDSSIVKSLKKRKMEYGSIFIPPKSYKTLGFLLNNLFVYKSTGKYLIVIFREHFKDTASVTIKEPLWGGAEAVNK